MFKYVFKRTWLKLLVGAADVFGSIIFAPIFFLRRVLAGKKPVKKIIVLRLDQTGDCVQAIPFFSELRKQYPEAFITAAVLKGNAFLFKENSGINSVMAADSSWFLNDKNAGLKWAAGLFSEIRSGNYDLGFDLRGDIRNIALLFFSGVKKIKGYGCAGGGFMLDEKAIYDREMHEMDKNLRLLGKPALEPPIRLSFPESGMSEAQRLINEHKAAGKFTVVMHPFAGTPAKQWGLEKFKELCARIAALKGDAVIFITGGPQDAQAAEGFVTPGGSVFNMTGVKFATTISLIKKGDLFIGNDSSLQYFAAYQGVKTCVIYGHTSNNARWAPKVETEKIVKLSKPVGCGPCESRSCARGKHECMDIITVDDVFDAVKAWIPG